MNAARVDCWLLRVPVACCVASVAVSRTPE